MPVEELHSCVEKAIEKSQEIVFAHPNSILSEADFEKLLCHCISEQTGEKVEEKPANGSFSVHTQISHYIKKNEKYSVGERVDILILDEHLLQINKNERKEEYSGFSIAIELKYLRSGDSASMVNKDFMKWKDIKKHSSLYIVVLLDMKREKKYEEKKEKIIKFYNDVEDKGAHLNKLYCHVLRRKS